MEGTEAEKDSVSIWFVREALAGLKRRGLEPDGILSAVGISSSLIQTDQSRVSSATFGALWLAIAAALDDELFGMDTRRMKVGSFALLCRMGVQTESLHQALGLAIQFFNVVMDDARLELVIESSGARIALLENPVAQRPLPYRIFAHETLLILAHGLMCWLIGRRITLRRASFAYPQPPWWREYLSMYSSELDFDQIRTEIAFDSRHLNAPVVRTTAEAREFLREAPHNFIVKFKDSKSYSARIRKRMRAAPPESWPDFAGLAAELAIPQSSLHRRLAQEGATFRQIKDDLRRDLAIDLLTHSSESMAEIAEALGFAEPSAFHRAFKAWTGVRPGDYRRKELAPPANRS